MTNGRSPLRRLILLCIGLPLAGALLTSFVVLHYMYQTAQDEQRTKNMQGLNDVVARLHAETMGGEAMGAALLMGLNEPLIKEMAKEKLPRDHPETLARMVAAKRFFNADGVFIVNAAGVIVAHESDIKRSTGMNVSARSYVKQAMANKSSVYPAISISTGDKVFYIAAPIYEGDTEDTPVIGTLTIRMLAEPVIIKYLKMLPGQALLVSPEGIVFSSTKFPWMYSATLPMTKEHLEYVKKEKRYGKTFDDKTPEVLPIDISGESVTLSGHRYTISRDFFDWNDLGGSWQLVVIQDTRRLVPALRITMAIVVTIIAYVVVGYLMFVILSQRLLKTQDDIRIKKLSSVIENSPVAVIITDTEGIIEYVNEAFVQITGYSVSEATGRNPSILKSGFTPQETYLSLWSVLTAGRLWQGEFINKRKDGSLYTASSTITALSDQRGRVANYVGLQEDITQRKQMDEALRKSQQRLAFLVQNSPLGIIEWDINFRVITWNSAAEDIFGYTSEEAIGRLASELILPEEVRTHADEVWLTLSRQRGVVSIDSDNITKNGQHITCHWYNVTLADEAGQPIGVTSIVDDITHRRKMETELRQYLQELERFSKLVVNREEKMISLKQEVNALKEECGHEKKYKIVQ
ncbi:multi-sensor hybrid histidine kinase [Candidatus Magnetobacterium bavaricum]|uniref:Multi-sensor hybrid histidine kinase n=1 Tax=Candidatus Magnetobacterium bavaricum TaxID=29290 RepID=A0A0F3GUC4_9BACT|nr:multi-sensor hybrid histidine kinase [Candidatus Magnetobacterium bavaricum]